MKKHLVSVLIFTSMLLVLPTYSTAAELAEDLLEKSLISHLRGHILLVVGGDWFQGKEKILEIRQDEKDLDSVIVKVQVVTFQGPHSPPYMQEIITFNIQGHKIIPIDYFNKVIPESDWSTFNIP
ncbi:DUF3888 domain-containing protein [Neobacillus sp. YIM B06451]|uniref:DUF3888 domain-containing protein n=1 Tax=Neobacillus sp. YIM B06451 TaxID=3070994 RepID=UPI0029314673|nr:DUF3888 domain-containing protein [Neobacillus sp. YIM B06451]